MATELDSTLAARAERWHADRRRGIGGSDLAHLFEIGGPYGGCRRRLWYDKSNLPADSPRVQTDAMLRGKMLEDVAAQQYELDTGRTLLSMKRPRQHHEYPWARVNVDRGIAPVAEHEGRGVLEIKTQNAWMFRRTRREGLSEGYILQVQHAMWVTGNRWGAFMVLQPDSWGRAQWDVAADPELHEAIRRLGDEFWPTVGVGPMPEKLAADDPRCVSCPWRQTCQGLERLRAAAGLTDAELREPVTEDESFAELVTDYVAARDAISELTALQDRIKTAMKEKLGDADAVECSAGRIYYRTQTSNRIDVTALRANDPELAKTYTRATTSRPLRVFLTGGHPHDDE